MGTKQSHSFARVAPRVFFLGLIAAGHILFAIQLRKPASPAREMSVDAQPVFADFFSPESAEERAPLRRDEIPPQTAEFPFPDLPADALSAIDEPAIEAPRIDPQSAPDIQSYAERAELMAGKTATVLLEVAVGADGIVTSAHVVRSNGGDAVNAAALDYARETRWIPGTVDGQPQPMQASLTVILGEHSSGA